MTITEWEFWFDLISDKVGSPYFNDTEKEAFFNRAITQYINDFFKPYKQDVNAEKSSIDQNKLRTIIESVNVTSDANGLITYDNINTLLSTELSYVLNIEHGKKDCNGNYSYKRSRFVRHNDILKWEENEFLEPTDSKPKHNYFSGGVQLYPETPRRANITLVRKPLEVSIGGGIDCELPDITHVDILYKALSLAGISIREDELYAEINNSKLAD